MATGYGGLTPRYRIPYITFGDVVSQASEQIAALTIENQLRGLIAGHSGGNGVIRTGNFSVSFVSGNSTATLQIPASNVPSIEGFIDQIYVRSFSTLQWTGLPDNSVLYLYVELIESDTQSSRVRGDINVDWNDTGIVPDNAIVVAKVTTTLIDATIDDNPPERINLNTVATHAANGVNPHGNILLQDQIHVSGLTVIENANFNDLLVRGKLSVSGVTEFNDGLEVFGEARFNDGITTSGLSTFIGDAIFSGTATFSESAVFEEIIATSGIESYGSLVMHGDILMPSGALVDGRDLSADGLSLDSHVADITGNPHNVTIEQISGVSIFGGPDSELLGHLPVRSGVAIDGVDLSTLKFLIDGSNADPVYAGPIRIRDGHTHNMSGIAINFIGLAPEYIGSVLSGTGTGYLDTRRYEDSNVYRWRSDPEGVTSGAENQVSIWTELGVPGDFDWLSGIELTLATPSATANHKIDIDVFDTNGSSISLSDSQGLQSTGSNLETKTVGVDSPLTPIFVPGSFFSVQTTIHGVSGADVFLGDLKMTYRTIFPGAI